MFLTISMYFRVALVGALAAMVMGYAFAIIAMPLADVDSKMTIFQECSAVVGTCGVGVAVISVMGMWACNVLAIIMRW